MADRNARGGNSELEAAWAELTVAAEASALLRPAYFRRATFRARIAGQPRDTWQQLYEFSEANNTSVSAYDAESSWPVAIDEFVEWLKKHP